MNKLIAVLVAFFAGPPSVTAPLVTDFAGPLQSSCAHGRKKLAHNTASSCRAIARTDALFIRTNADALHAVLKKTRPCFAKAV